MKLSKTQLAELTGLIVAAQRAETELSAAVEEANEELERRTAALNDLVEAYNEALGALAAFRDDWAAEVQGVIDEKSERWQEGDAGMAHAALLEEWEALELDALDGFEAPEFEFDPRDLDAVEGASSDTADC
jgi:hypothetical protein